MTPDDIARAVKAIDPAAAKTTRKQCVALHRKVQSRSRWVAGLDAEELLGEAVARTLDGTHKLKPGVNVFAHLHMVVKHLVNDARRKKGLHRLESAVVKQPDADRTSPEHRPGGTHPGERLDVAGYLEALEQELQGDELAWTILTAGFEGMKGPQIREEFEISKNDYAAKMKKIRRTETAVRLRAEARIDR